MAKNLLSQSSNVSFAGLSLRGGGRGFSQATTNLAPGYFHRKIEEKQDQKKSLAGLIPRLLVVFTWQLEILVTTLHLQSKLQKTDFPPIIISPKVPPQDNRHSKQMALVTSQDFVHRLLSYTPLHILLHCPLDCKC